MISKLAVDAGDVFTAVAGSGSFLHTGDSASSIKRIPIWLTMGTEDPLFANTNFPTLPYGGDSITIYFKKAFTRIRAVQGLQDIFELKETGITKTFTYNQCIIGEKCKPFIFTLIKGMGHEYPNGINFPLIAANNFWEFFENACQATNSIQTIGNKEQIQIFPNPSHDFIKIQSPNSYPVEAKIYSMDGKLVLNKRYSLFPAEIKKSEIGEGIFLVVFYNNKVQFQKIIFY